MKILGLTIAASSALTGCIIQDGYGYEEVGFIDSSWAFHTAAGESLTCPAPFTHTAVTARSLSGFRPIVDLYDCNARFAPAEYPLDIYDMDLVVSDIDGRNVYATSPLFRVDIIDFDAEIGEDFIHDGGRIVFDWTLVDATSNTPLTCASAGVDKIEISASAGTDRAPTTQQFTCSDRLEDLTVTNPLLAGEYTFTVTPIDFAGERLGDAQNATITVEAPNHYAEGGVITLPVQTNRVP